MGQSTPELPADTLVSAVDNARRGAVTHITIKDVRVAAIVSQSTLAMAQLLAALLTSEMAASALPAALPAAFPWASSLPDDHLKTFASELREAVVAESPDRVERVLTDWQAVAEVRAGPRSTLAEGRTPSGSVTRANGSCRLAHASSRIDGGYGHAPTTVQHGLSGPARPTAELKERIDIHGLRTSRMPLAAASAQFAGGSGVRSGNTKAGPGVLHRHCRRFRDSRGWRAAPGQAGASRSGRVPIPLCSAGRRRCERRRCRRRSWRRWHPAGRRAGAGGDRRRPRSPRLPPELACRCATDEAITAHEQADEGRRWQ